MNTASSDSRDSPAQPASAPSTSLTHERRILILLSVVCLIATVAYSSVLFNFFVGDDFVHLYWLRDAFRDPNLILKNFYSSWLDGTVTKFYRPLISVLMVSDYLFGRTNGLVFHFTNLFFLLISSVSLFFICRSIQTDTTENRGVLFPLTAAALFSLHPLHPEAVAWITGRVDAVVTAFYLLSLLSYIKWRAGQTKIVWSLLFFILALLSKEMAIMLPCTFVVYELTILRASSLLSSAARAVLMTIPFWSLLALYFVVRYFSLGTFIGGYDDSLTFISNWHDFVFGWMHGLRMVFVPINRSLIGEHNALTICWEIGSVLAAALVVYNVTKDNKLVDSFIFFLVWAALCFAPVYKIFAIADDLQGSRLAYLASAPICCALSLAFVRHSKTQRLVRIFQNVLLPFVLTLAFILLILNNGPWMRAGKEANAIRAGLENMYAKIQGDPQVLLVGLPDQIEGAFICRNALPGMLHRPQFSRDIDHCLMVNQFEPVLPFGFLKRSISENREKIIVARWDCNQKQFETVSIPQLEWITTSKPLRWQGRQLEEVTFGQNATKLETKNSGSIAVVNDDTNTRPSVRINPGPIPCFNCDFIKLTFSEASETGRSRHPGADLYYTNDLVPNVNPNARVHAEFDPALGPQSIVFSMRSLPGWSLGGNTHSYKICFPEGSRLKLQSVEIVPAAKVMPSINFKNSNYMGTKGFIHIGKDATDATIDYDTSSVLNAAGIEFEITRPNLLFGEQNTSIPSSVVMKTMKLGGTNGVIDIDKNIFPAIGLYEGRAWSLNKAGKRIGVAGDHIVFSVDSI